jgi:peptidoglycan/xylan/chitin deacetylase (PgdA/CDA1 family)
MGALPTPRITLLLIALALLCGQAHAQMQWPRGKVAAIVLTYDDALHSQLDVAVPQLARAGLRGTFFLDGDITPDDMLRWRAVERAGHELGNHSVNHPCPRAMLPGRAQYHTEDYDVSRMLGEIAVMNDVLFGIDGQRSRTYSVPCSQMLVGGVDYTDALRDGRLVKYVRTGGDAWRSVVTDAAQLDFYQVPSYGPVDQPDGATLIAYVERVRAARGLGVLQFHGTGGDYLQVSADAHQALVDHLRRHRDVWVAPFREVMDYVATRPR